MQKMGLCRECRLRLMVLNTVMRRLTLSYELGLWNKVHKVGQLYVRSGIYGVHLIGKTFSMAFTILTFGCVLEYMYSSYNRIGRWGYNGSNNGYMGFIKAENYLLVWQIHEFVHDTVWKIGMEVLYDKVLHKDKVWVENFGPHYSHQFGFSKHIKFVF